MNIHIFEQEIKDGIADVIKASASLAYDSELSIDETPVFGNKSIAENKDQFDLYYLQSILVSTGWNKNDDVFLPDSTWAARRTPEDKQFNFMHDEDIIIGHITGCHVVDKNGVIIDDNQEQAPEDFDIITKAVLYNSWTKEENVERMRKLISEIKEGKWYVSMECLFAGFDYALQDESGQGKILAREESTAFLTKHLRSYGGDGVYENYKIGRALRKISFSGKGLVSKPANPRSIILNSQASETAEQKGEKVMPQDFEAQIKDLTEKLKASEAANELLKAEKEKHNSEKLQALETEYSELEAKANSFSAKIQELESQLAETTQQLEAAMKDMKEMKKKEKMAKRMATLIEAGFEQEEAEAMISIESLEDDSAFEAVVAAMKKKMAKMYMKKEKEKEMATEAPTQETFENLEKKTEAALNISTEDSTNVEAAVASFYNAYSGDKKAKGKK